MRWATRTGCHVDRAACAWALRRFVDPDADFVFVDDRVLEVGAAIFDGLYEYRRLRLLGDRPG